jgi:hypothetical protein
MLRLPKRVIDYFVGRLREELPTKAERISLRWVVKNGRHV